MGEVIDATGFALSSYSQTLDEDEKGIGFTPKVNCTLKNVTNYIRSVGAAPNTMKLYLDSTKELLDTQSITGTYPANGSSDFDYELTSGTKYVLVATNSVTWYASSGSSPGFVVSGTNVDFNNSIKYDGGTTSWIEYTTGGYVITSVTTEVAASDNAMFMGCNL